MLFTHGTWQNIFQGYPVSFGKILIEDDAWLPWHVMVLPNVIIGRGATLGAGSLVTKNIPPYSLAVGVPAKVIKMEGYPKQQTIEEKDEIAKNTLRDFMGYMNEFKGRKVNLSEKAGIIVIRDAKGETEFIYCKSIKSPKIRDKTLVSFNIPESYWKHNDWIDLEQETMSIKDDNWLAHEFVSFVRRYGVRPVVQETK